MRRICAIALATVAVLVLPAQASAGWSSSQDLVGSRDDYATTPSVAFSSHGLAVVTGTLGLRPYVVRRRPGSDFSRPRFLANLELANFTPIVDPDGGGALFGSYLDYAPEESDLRFDCCDRVVWRRMTTAGRVGGLRKLSPHGSEVFRPVLTTDGRGGAGAVWNDKRWVSTTRRRGGGFATPEPFEAPEGVFGDGIATRPSGWTFAAWPDPERRAVNFAQKRPGRPFGRPLSTPPLDPQSSLRVSSVQLAVGERGHVWVLFDLIPANYNPAQTRIVAAPRRHDGTLGSARTIMRSSGLFSSIRAVDDRGALHLAAQREAGLDVVSVSQGGRIEGPRRLSKKSAGAEAIDAAGDGRVVVVWREGSRLIARDRVAGGRFNAARQLDRGLETGTGANVTVGPRRESIVTWVFHPFASNTNDVRYAVLTR